MNRSAFAAALLALFACATNPATGQMEFDAQAAGVELGLVAEDIRVVLPALSDEDMAAQFSTLADTLDMLAVALQEDGSTGALGFALNAAQAALDQLIVRDDLTDEQFLLIAFAGGVLRRVEVYVL